jgi:hypothetical protein
MAWSYEITVRTRFPGMPEVEYIETLAFDEFVTPEQAAGKFLIGFRNRFGNLNPRFTRIRLLEPQR